MKKFLVLLLVLFVGCRPVNKVYHWKCKDCSVAANGPVPAKYLKYKRKQK